MVALLAAAALALLAAGLQARTSFARRACAVVSAEPTDEYSVKAAFLYNFARYVKWPDTAFRNAEAPLVIAVVGKDPFGAVLDAALKDKRAGARRIAVQRFDSIATLGACHLLFVAPGVESELAKIQACYDSKPVLLVADTIAAVEAGAQVGFFVEKSKVRFAINPQAVKAAQLQVGSELLKLARIVDKRPAEPVR